MCCILSIVGECDLFWRLNSAAASIFCNEDTFGYRRKKLTKSGTGTAKRRSDVVVFPFHRLVSTANDHLGSK